MAIEASVVFMASEASKDVNVITVAAATGTSSSYLKFR